ncbi:MAG: histidine phosphatase family protein [Ruminococcaceae bacterium]|nr:histidine phosphatase family protein [Oscillospiraceae bacterium]
MKTIILIRHGESETNTRKVFTGQLNAALTQTGREQARLMAEYLDKYEVDKLYVSSLQRAVDTAKPIVQRQNCPVELCDELMEINSGLWQGLTFVQISERFPDTHAAWKIDIDNAAPDGGETCRQLFDRVTVFLKKVLQEPEETVCFVCHATPIRMLESYFLNKPAQEIPWVPNASVTVYTYDGTFHAAERGSCGFLGSLSSNLPKSI